MCDHSLDLKFLHIHVILLMPLHPLLSSYAIDGVCAWWGALAWDLPPPAATLPKLQAQCLLAFCKEEIRKLECNLNLSLRFIAWNSKWNCIQEWQEAQSHVLWHSPRSVSGFVESLEAQRLSLISTLNLLLKDFEILALFSLAVIRWKLGKLFNIPQPVVSLYKDR